MGTTAGAGANLGHAQVGCPPHLLHYSTRSPLGS